MTTFDLMQEVVLLDGTSLTGIVIDKGYKVSINGSDGRWYKTDELAAAPPVASGTADAGVSVDPTLAKATLENYAQGALSVIHAKAAFGLEREQANTILWLIEYVQKLNTKLENEREAWIEVQRRVQDARDEARWRTAERDALRAALEPFAAQWREWSKPENEWAHGTMDIVEYFNDYLDNEMLAGRLKAAYEALQAASE